MTTLVPTKHTTRDAILDATDRLMTRYGFRKMTMDDIAREAGVSRRTIYIYFESKLEVGLSSIGRVVEHVHDELREIASSDAPQLQKLGQMLRRRVMGRVEQVQDYAHSLDELFELVRPSYLAARQRYFMIERDLIASVLGPEGQEPLAEALMLATNAFLPYSLSIRELGSPAVIAERLEVMIALLLKGLSGSNVN